MMHGANRSERLQVMRWLTNPLFLYVAVWTTAGTLYLLGIRAGMFPDLESITAVAVLLSLGAFALGYLTWAFFHRLSPTDETPAPAGRTLGSTRIARWLKLSLLMGIIAMALGLYRVAVIAAYFDVSFAFLITHPGWLRLWLVIYLGMSHAHIDFIPVLISLASSLFAVGFVLLGVFLCISRSFVRFVYLAAFLFVTLAVGLTNLSRYEVTVNVLYLVLAYGLTYVSSARKSPRDAVFDLLLPLASVVVLFATVDVLLGKSSAYGHADRLRGALFSFYWYIASPLAAFNEFLTGFDGPYQLGQYMFYPFYKWLYRFGLVSEPTFAFYGEMTFLPFMTNVYTYLRNVYEDFGMLGVAVVPYVLGWGTCALRPLALRSLPFLNLYVIVLVLILFSFYNYFLNSSQMYLQILFGFVFFRFELPRRDASHVTSVVAASAAPV
ncbi:MAG: oligosaccharide repeat unit polymerase [Sedimentisphaerales bacterium]|nr:oligosaccharide repeat unit polymerase [Sedimentisphaerales bacterium]